MRFISTPLQDLFVLESEPHEDSRGYFVRLRCSRELSEHGLPDTFVQSSLSFNVERGTFRGLHFQVPPSREGKLVRCVSGAVRDIVVDLRPYSDTFLKHVWITLDSARFTGLLIPPGCAHGFITEEDRTAVLYEMSDYYEPELARGIRWDDPLLGLDPIPGITQIHPRDASYPDASREDFEVFRK